MKPLMNTPRQDILEPAFAQEGHKRAQRTQRRETAILFVAFLRDYLLANCVVAG